MLLKKVQKDERGSVLVLVIVVLVTISVLGATMLTLSKNQIDMATNLKVKEMAQYNCDSCTTTVSKLIRHVVDQSNEGVLGIKGGAGSTLAPGIGYAPSTTGVDPQVEFAQKVLFGLEAAGCEDVWIDQSLVSDAINAASGGKLVINAGELDSAADIRSTVTVAQAGSAASEHMGGIGHGLGESGASGGGMVMKFVIACRGMAPYNALHVGYAVYRKNLHVGKGY
jgi:hypothetical protein